MPCAWAQCMAACQRRNRESDRQSSGTLPAIRTARQRAAGTGQPPASLRGRVAAGHSPAVAPLALAAIWGTVVRRTCGSEHVNWDRAIAL
jgi:hypothetical protein